MSYPRNVMSERSEVEVGNFAGGGRYRRFEVDCGSTFFRLVLGPGPDEAEDSPVASLPLAEKSPGDRLDIVPDDELGDEPSCPSSVSIDRLRFGASVEIGASFDAATVAEGGWRTDAWNFPAPMQHLLAMNVRFPSTLSESRHLETSSIADEVRLRVEIKDRMRINAILRLSSVSCATKGRAGRTGRRELHRSQEEQTLDLTFFSQ